MTKLMTWTLHAPSSSQFSTYRDLAPGEPWNSKNYVLVNPDGMKDWDYRKRGFVEMIEKYPDKFYAIGLHQFGINQQGRIYNMGYGTHAFDQYVLNSTETEIALPIEKSLRYLIHHYPQIKWSLQFLCTTNSVGNRVEPILDDVGGAQQTFLRECYNVMRLYLEAGFTNIKGVEIDFEKTTSRPDDHIKFKNLLAKVKNEVCIPLGLELRVNMFAMTGDFTPSYYGWHDYATLASARDAYGNQAVDEFQLMTYDFSWGGSAPGPSTPLWWLEQVLDHVKDLDSRGIWNAEDVFIGNAGYGRRWPLGENRYGVTMDYKMLMLAQNGAYIHNSGASDENGQFWFNDQDFIPTSGFNDEESDYQKTFLNVYDRFKLTKTGGGTFTTSGTGKNVVNQPAGAANYITNYSRRQYCQFGGVQEIVTAPTATSGRVSTAADTDQNFVKRSNLGSPVFSGYLARNQYLNPETGEPTGKPEDEEGLLTYEFSASGSARLIAAVRWPFFDQADITIELNGTPIYINGNQYDWNPFMQAQETHFVDLGVRSFAGSNTITVGDTKGAQIFGFVICSSFDYNMRGGEATFPANLQPMKRRGEVINGEVQMVDAQYPDFMRVVGEVLTRPPRPAIIWEDIFSSYVDSEVKTDDILKYRYYPRISDANQGYTLGNWTATYGGESDYDYAYNDSRNASAQLMLNKAFSANMAIDIELRADGTDRGNYGIRILAVDKNGGHGYIARLNYARQTVEIVWEDRANGVTERIIATKPMSDSLKTMNGQRIRLRAYVLGNKLSFWVEKNPYFNQIDITGRPSSGAYGIYVANSRLKVYKYNVSTLDRWERMERMEVITGGQTYYFDEVERKADTVYDEFGFIVKTCYPGEIADAIAIIGDDSGGATVGDSTVAGTILETQADPNFEWSNDYKNKALAVVPSWQGKQDVTIRFRDAGIWFRNLYVGDNEGMSVAYNSDRIGFIKTANFVNTYGCKGIALWTLGQEDPTIYSYITG